MHHGCLLLMNVCVRALSCILLARVALPACVLALCFGWRALPAAVDDFSGLQFRFMYPWIRLAPRMDRLAAASDRIDALMRASHKKRDEVRQQPRGQPPHTKRFS
jgi:hypothetical protein